jgi:hypothetical protein
MCLFCSAQNKFITTISGTIKDSLQQKPLTFATVTLFYKNHPKALRKATNTDEKGQYLFSQIDTGTYVLAVTYIGYKEQRLDLQVNGEQNIILPNILLPLSYKNTLGTIVIAARKNLVQQDNEKLIYNVEDDPSAKGELAIDVFRKLPFVSVDGEDNIKLNGQSNFKVLLNGRETSLFARNVKEALKGFPGALITKIEVITSPSAKYDAEGVGGIINIITKKKIVGYNAYLNSYYNTNNYYGGGGNINAKFGRVGFTGTYNVSKSKNIPGINYSETKSLVPAFYKSRTTKGENLSNSFWQSGNAEVSWDMDSLNTLVAYGYIGRGNSSLDQNYTITTQLSNALTPALSYFNMNSSQEFPSENYGLDFISKSKHNPERELSLRFYNDRSQTFYTLGSEQLDSNYSRFVLNENTDHSRQYTAQADLTLPFNRKHKLELGGKSIWRRANADYNSQIKYNTSSTYTADPKNSDLFDYSQDVFSGYFMYTANLKKASFRVGARVEYTDVKGNFTTTHTAINTGYTNILPNVQYTQRFGRVYSMVLNYGQRLQRPYINSLNPFINNSDTLNISFGNPELNPQTIHNLSWQHRFLKGAFFAGLTFSGAYSNNMIVQYTSFDKTTGVSSTTSTNLGRSYQLSAGLNMNLKLTNAWRLTLNSDLRYNRIEKKIAPFQLYEGTGSSGSLNTFFKIGKLVTFSSNAGFLQLPPATQVQNELQYWYGSALSIKMFQEKVNLSFNYANFLSQYFDYKSAVKDVNFITYNTNSSRYRRLNISLLWSFGKLSESVSKKKGVYNDDLLETEKRTK